VHGPSRVQLDAQSGGFGGGMTKAVVANGAQSGGQHVTQIAAHELDPREGFYFRAVVIGTIFPAKSHGVVSDRQNAAGTTRYR
jgi:hypothetical protein